MADELELLKKDWKNQEANLPHLTASDIYPMLLKKSSSLVKWIFIISIIEFAFWLAISFLFGRDRNAAFIEEAGLENYFVALDVINYGALLFFIGWFYINYRKISTTASARVLMKNILKARQTVKFYVWFNLCFLGLALITTFILVVNNAPSMADKNLVSITLAFTAVLIGVLIAVWFFYRLIYGIIARRLMTNYKELKKLEV
ncbi:hypothetical protein [Croceiramulus getboli]|nr:hypothetical protein P8624_10955 [Flavobacteriaceae bacterium YJPT1-3]